MAKKINNSNFSPMSENGKPRVKKNGNGNGMGDYSQFGQPNDLTWNTIEHGVVLPPAAPVIVDPKARNPLKPETAPAEDAAGYPTISEERRLEMEVMTQMLKEKLTCGTWFVKRPLWMEPPITAVCFDESTTAAGATIPAGAPGLFRTLFTHTVPDRFIAVVAGLGNMLENEAAFVGVEWRIRINDKPVGFQSFSNPPDPFPATPGTFRSQLGDPSNPTILPCPIIAKYGDVLTIEARSLDGAAHTTFFRWFGWEFPFRGSSNDGSYSEFHTP